MIFRDPHNPSSENKIILDPKRAKHVQRLFAYVAEEGLSGRQVNERLHEQGFRTRKGKRITLSMTYRMLKESFYYGEFEYPRGSGNWYEGTHEPLITKEQWEAAQKMIKTYEKSKWGSKNYYFSRLFKCGSCQSGVCGEDHVNRHGKNYTYYKCTKYGGAKRCDEKYIQEKDLISSIAKLSEQKYVEYILRHGTPVEKREFLACLEGQLYLKGGKVWLNELEAK